MSHPESPRTAPAEPRHPALIAAVKDRPRDPLGGVDRDEPGAREAVRRRRAMGPDERRRKNGQRHQQDVIE